MLLVTMQIGKGRLVVKLRNLDLMSLLLALMVSPLAYNSALVENLENGKPEGRVDHRQQEWRVVL